MIPIKDLIINGLYFVDGHNFSVAVWDGKYFTGRRHKFTWRLASELHYDSDPHYGTVKPVFYISQLPDGVSAQATGPNGQMNHALFGILTVIEDERHMQMKEPHEYQEPVRELPVSRFRNFDDKDSENIEVDYENIL